MESANFNCMELRGVSMHIYALHTWIMCNSCIITHGGALALCVIH